MSMRPTIASISLLLLLGAGCASPSVPERATYWGVSLSPSSYTADGFTAFFPKAKEAGQLLTWAGPWQDMTTPSGAPFTTVTQARQRGMRAAVITAPTAAEIADPAKRAAFRDAAVAFAKEQKPDFMGLGNEINRTFDAATLRTFADLFAETRLAVRRESPDTQVFPVFQYEWLVGKRGGLFGGKNDPSQAQWDELALFPDADLIAFTFYPALAFKDPQDIPADYFTEVTKHVTTPVAVSETGWFRGNLGAGWSGSSEEQAVYIRRLPELLGEAHPRFVVWPFLYDPKTTQPFDSAGLLAPGQETSPAWEAWKSISP